MALSAPSMPMMPGNASLEALQNRSGDGLEAEKKRLAKVAREFESLFIHQVMAAMRKTVPKNDMQVAGLSSGMGKDVFTDMFDMELAKGIADGKPGSLAHALYKQMERLIDAAYSTDTPEAERSIKPLSVPQADTRHIPLDNPAPELKIDTDTRLNGLPERTGRPAVGIRPTPSPKPQPPEATEPNQPKRWDPTIPLPDEPPPPNPLRDMAQIRRAVTSDSILSRFGQLIDEAAGETQLDSALIYSVVKAESNGQPDAVSHAGAKGLMQLIDSTAADYGVEHVFDPAENIRAGSRYLRDLLDRFDGNLELALAAYNAGPGNVRRYGGIPPFKETQEYVQRVMSRYHAIRAAKVRR